MKLDTRSPEILSSGNIDETMFSMDESSLHIVFDVLRSKVYKNPIGSLCREIASNSRDAHREIGDNHTKIEIEISDGRDDFFFIDGLNIIFRDYGVGLSPKRIKEVYSKYGASTKRDTNEMTGGFGLGAKTPFAYCDAFTVRTVVSGVEYIYSIYIDETKKGKIALLNEQPYDSKKKLKGNMTEIIVPLKDSDKNRFQKECIRNTFFWENRPKLIGFSEDYDSYSFYKAPLKVEGIPLEVKGEYRILPYTRFIESPIGAIIDGIYYPVDTSILGYDLSDANFAILFEFENGEIEVGANREQLQYDDFTIEVLKSKIDGMLDLFQKQYNKMIEGAKTLFDAQATCMNLCNNDILFKMLNRNKQFYYTLKTGKKVKLVGNPSYEPKAFQVYICEAASTESFRLDKDEVSNIFTQRIADNLDNLFIITKEDRAKNKFKMLSSISRTILDRSKNKKFVLFWEYTHDEYSEAQYTSSKARYEADNSADWEKFNELGITFQRYWDVVPDKKAAPVRVKKETITLKTFTNGAFNRNDYRFDNDELSLYGAPANICYYYSDYEMEITKGSSVARTLQTISHVIHVVEKDMSIVISSKLKAKYFSNYESVDEVLKRHLHTIEKMAEKQKFSHHISTAQNYLSLGIDLGHKADLEYLVSLNKYGYMDLDRFSQYVKERKINFTIQKRDFDSLFRKIHKEYPLIESMYSTGRKEYVKLVNELNEYRSKYGKV